MTVTRATQVLSLLAIASAAVSAAAQPAPLPSASLTPQTALPPKAIPPFVDRLPVLSASAEPLWSAYPRIETVVDDGETPLAVHMCEFQTNVLPTGTFAPGQRPATWTWGYRLGGCPAAGALPQDTFLGPVVVATRGAPTTVRYVNALPASPDPISTNPLGTHVIAYSDSVDQTLHWADANMQMCMSSMPPALRDVCTYPYRDANGAMGIPAAPHLHGGEIPAELDGSPDSWFTSTGMMNGPTWYASPLFSPAPNETVYRYPNSQEAGPLWFHDHTLGATRLNVYAGLAGGYVLVDPDQQLPAGLENPANIVPLILQDRMFDTNGELFFTAGTKGGILWALNPEHPYWNPEFVGDTLLVNGTVWPYLEVEPKRYRFLFVNGSNARTYELFLTNPKTKINGPAMWIIGTDGGYVDVARKIDPTALKPAPQRLVIMPGERYEVIIDFGGQPAGTTLVLKNVAKTPYPGGATPAGGLSQLMQLRIACPPAPAQCGAGGIAWNPAVDPTIRSGAGAVKPLVAFDTGTLGAGVTAQKTRLLTLNEVMGMPVNAVNPIDGVMTAYPGGPLEILVNNTKWSGASARNDPASGTAYRGDFTELPAGGLHYSELPAEGETELWEIANLTADSHPIHLHLVQFQLLNRQALDVPKYAAAYAAAFPQVNDPATGQPLMIGMNVCTAGAYCPGYGPPLHYDTGTPGKFGGNPDVTRFLKSVPVPAAAQERGWKDTVQVPPGTVTRFVVRWAPTSADVGTTAAFPFDPSGQGGAFNYVWHCHIIDHEDNEMMRPDTILPIPGASRTYVMGEDY
ncbi:multicopper oxidase type 2 [Anaeromyxobacter dehalogenans 2CP-1]|uniref:Multicopper oxidase type 2 n=1 Tax=Anaeromyxobacter dehalogenans (strain ATCC BAA-258 / DSM 21875 / 2CP-1) TaxID=455488 RepID=B8J5A8_ANAD2|nr:multicopper oxidase type 2 [Anaeromyxobacter dehalogenans 2CP-1]